MESVVGTVPVSRAAGSAADVAREDLEYVCARLTGEFTQMAGKNLLITGGAGFLGYYLVQAVLHWNHMVAAEGRIRVSVFDNYVRGVPGWLERRKEDPQLTLVKHDVTDPMPPGAPEFQYIIHAASIASPTYYRRFPIETMDANVQGLRHLLEYSKRRRNESSPVEGFLFFSTSEIYGDPDPSHIPTAETYRGNVSCTGPRACYDESKRFGETLCVNFAQAFDLPIRIARPFNNYGPGLKFTDRRVLPDFARNVLHGEDIVMLSDGSPTRTYCYVADAVTGYYKVLAKGRNGESYNIGVEAPEISIAELAERVVRTAGELFGYAGRVVRQTSADPAYLTDNPNRRCPVIDKARSELGYDPQVSLDEGLRRSLLWYRDSADADYA